MLCNLRVKAFAHIHRLSIADHNESQRGELTARVTSDVETIARFAQWGGVAWIVDTVIIVGTLGVMAIYSWQLTHRDGRGDGARCCRSCGRSSAASSGPTTWCAPGSARRLGAVSESVMGAGVIRAYGITAGYATGCTPPSTASTRPRCARPGTSPSCSRWATCSAASLSRSVVGVGAWWGPGWGLDAGHAHRLRLPGEPAARCRSPSWARSSTRPRPRWPAGARCSTCSTSRSTSSSPTRASTCPSGPVEVRAEGLDFAYRDGGRVLRGVDVVIPAGTSVAVVGETGSGKTTFAKLLCRLADPTGGRDPPRRRRPPRRRPGLAVRRRADGAPGRVPVRHDHPRQRAHGPRRRHRRRGRRRVRARSASTGGWPACPTASTPRSASGARACRSASASSWPWPGPSWPTPGC